MRSDEECCAYSGEGLGSVELQGFRVGRGRPLPLGVQDCCDGFNFAIFSRHAERVTLELYETAADTAPILSIDLHPRDHRTGDVWHILIDGARWGQAYAFRVSGPWAPEQGHRFDGQLSLLDPYALAVDFHHQREPARLSQRRDGGRLPLRGAYRSLLVNRRFDWQGTAPPKRPWSETVIYETHVRGLTVHPSARAERPGTFLGIAEKIPYFRDLGITAVELMPIQAFDDHATFSQDSVTGRPLHNYWGYAPVAFFAPHQAYAAEQATGCQVHEFKTMVRALHREGIEVILDVVFNHTAEGDETGPTFNFRGLDNAIYYLLAEDRRRYLNFSGCGNALNCNHPIVRDYIIDCLRYWVTEMHVDGFRFDLAAILGRDETGGIVANPPLLERIAEDPILRDVKLIAEAWDAGGAYEVGNFSGRRWAEWNGRYRDDVRRFWRGDPGMSGAFAWRLCGSADLYQRNGKEPVNSINFVTSHDGFTLNDLVTYAAKHNEANGEQNRDGTDANYSANYGTEGPSEDPAVQRVRSRQVRNMMATLLLSRGVPMILGGDEFGRTQCGNNNAYCQDNETSWYDWHLLETNPELVCFARSLIEFRRLNPVLSLDAFYRDDDVAWFGPAGIAPDWSGPTCAIGCLLRPIMPACAPSQKAELCLLFNASSAEVEFRLPAPSRSAWTISVDTSCEAPPYVFAPAEAPALPEPARCLLPARGLMVLSSL